MRESLSFGGLEAKDSGVGSLKKKRAASEANVPQKLRKRVY